MAYECFEERASLPAILINGVKAKNVRFGLVTGREGKGRHKPDSDGLSSVPIIVFLFMLKSFPKSKVLDGFMKIPCCFLF